MELGVWLENCRDLIETIGLKWRGREGYDWDWFVNVGFLEGYTPAETQPDLYHFAGSFDVAEGAKGGHSEGFSSVFGDELCRLAEKEAERVAVNAAADV